MNAQKDTGFTALMFAAEFGYVDCAQVLREHGANIDLGSQRGGTALIIGTVHGQCEITNPVIAKRR